MAEASVIAASISDKANGQGSEIVAECSKMAAPTKDTPSSKGKKKATKPELLEKRLDSLEQSLDCKFQQLFNFFHAARNENVSDGNAMRSSNSSENVAPTGESLHSPQQNYETSDTISLHPNEQESRNMKDFLGLSEDESESVDNLDLQLGNSSLPNRSPRVVSQDNATNKTHNILSQLFGESGNSEENGTGLLLDQSQVDILDKSWRCTRPERLSAFKEECRQAFPLHEDAKEFLQVPQLDELLETMLQQRHGPNSVKWGKSRQLASQPLKAIEGLSFQGQMAARYSVISVLYMQQALGTLLKTIQSDSSTSSNVTEIVKDIYSISTRTLDQCGRTGAFFHMVRRKAATADTGLASVNLQSKLLNLPLTSDGVFGKGLQEQLKQRKEQKDQLKELIPELNFKKPGPQKRKFPPSSSSNSFSNEDWPKPKYSKSSTTTSNRGKPRSGQSKYDYKQKSWDRSKADGASSFRIPKKD